MMNKFDTLFLILLFSVGCGTSGPLFAQEKLQVAVFDLKLDLEIANARGPDDQLLAKKASDRLRAELSKNPPYLLIDQTWIDQALQSVRAQGLQCTTDACAWEIGKTLKADRIVTGKIMKISTLISLVTARMIDVKTGKVLKEETLELKGTFSDIVPNAMAALSRRIIEEPHEALTGNPTY